MLFLFYVNVSGMSLPSRLPSQPLMMSAPWVLFRVKWSIPLVPLWMTASRFLAGNIEAELIPTAFSSLLLSTFLLSLLFSCVLLVLRAFDDTSSLDYPLRRVVYPRGSYPG